MPKNEVAEWIIDFETIEELTDVLKTLLTQISEHGKINKEDIKALNRDFNKISKMAKRCAVAVFTNKEVDDDVKNVVKDKAIKTSKLAISAIGKIQSLSVLTGNEFKKQVISLVGICESINEEIGD